MKKGIFKYCTKQIFNTLKVSSNISNSGYYIGDSVEYTNDNIPDILWDNIVFIDDGRIWTHGNFYNDTTELKNIVENLIEITYSELKYQRTNNQLIPGKQYCIIDNSVGEIIINALKNNLLDENAKLLKQGSSLCIWKDETEQEEHSVYIITDTPNPSISYNTFEDFKPIRMTIDSEEYEHDHYITYLYNDGENKYLCDIEYSIDENGEFESQEEYEEYMSNYCKNNWGDFTVYKLIEIGESNLISYNIKYSLDNDTDKYAYADINGKGVIYWIEDEYGNSAFFDLLSNPILKGSYNTNTYNNKIQRYIDNNGKLAIPQNLNIPSGVHDCIIGWNSNKELVIYNPNDFIEPII